MEIGGWRLVAVGGWRLVAIGGWRLVASGGWRLVVVGGGWRRLMVSDWWSAAVGGWSLLAVGGWPQLVVGGWRLVVPGAVPSKEKQLGSLEHHPGTTYPDCSRVMPPSPCMLHIARCDLLGRGGKSPKNWRFSLVPGISPATLSVSSRGQRVFVLARTFAREEGLRRGVHWPPGVGSTSPQHRIPCVPVGEFMPCILFVFTLVQTWASWQSPRTRRYSRELLESGIRAV